MMKKLFLILIWILGFSVLMNAQNKISELEKSLKTDTGKDKFETLYKLSAEKIYLL